MNIAELKAQFKKETGIEWKGGEQGLMYADEMYCQWLEERVIALEDATRWRDVEPDMPKPGGGDDLLIWGYCVTANPNVNHCWFGYRGSSGNFFDELGDLIIVSKWQPLPAGPEVE